MFAIQWKITRHSKKQKNMTHNEKKKTPTIKTRPELTLELANEDIKTIVIIPDVQKVKL